MNLLSLLANASRISAEDVTLIADEAQAKKVSIEAILATRNITGE
jgi:hypothetical protein